MITVDDVPLLARQAHAKAVEAGTENMTIEEFYKWMDTLPEDEAVAVLVELAELSSLDK